MANKEKENIFNDLKKLASTKDKFFYLIQVGKESAELSEEEKKEDNRIKGCNSLLWLVASLKDNKVYFKVDSDAAIPKGLGTVLAKIYSGLSPQEILTTDSNFLTSVGIEQHLSMNRRNGLANILKQINFYAIAYSAMLAN